MGYASGFRAGSALGESIIDAYSKARRNRDIQEIEAGLQRQRDDAIAEQEAQQANIQVMAGQQPGQAQQQQLARNVGLAPAINPQQSMVAPPGQQLAGRATNVPAMGQMSPVGSEAMGLGPAAKGPMSEADLNTQRALALRARGYTDEADRADAQARLLRQDERQLARDAELDRRYREEIAYRASRDAQADEEFNITAERLQNQVDGINSRYAVLNDQARADMANTAEDRAIVNATRAGQNAYFQAGLNNTSITSAMNTLPEGVQAGSPAATAYQTAIAGKYLEDTGLGAGQIGSVTRLITSSVEEVVNTSFDNTEEGQTAELREYNRVLENIVPDPDATDDIVPELVVNNEGKYQVMYGGRAMTEPMDSAKAIAENYLKEVKGNLGYTIDYLSAKERDARARILRAKDLDARRQIISDLADDPLYAQNPQLLDSVLEKAGFQVGFTAGGDYDLSTLMRVGVGGYTPPADSVTEPTSATREDISPAARRMAGFIRDDVPRLFAESPIGGLVNTVTSGLGTASDYVLDTAAALREEEDD